MFVSFVPGFRNKGDPKLSTPGLTYHRGCVLPPAQGSHVDGTEKTPTRQPRPREFTGGNPKTGSPHGLPMFCFFSFMCLFCDYGNKNEPSYVFELSFQVFEKRGRPRFLHAGTHTSPGGCLPPAQGNHVDGTEKTSTR